jgi:hypothetical protein
VDELPRSITQPFQVLWLSGVQIAADQTPFVQVPLAQVPPAFWHEFFEEYPDLEHALLFVQLLCVVSSGFEQTAALVQLFWLL